MFRQKKRPILSLRRQALLPPPILSFRGASVIAAPPYCHSEERSDVGISFSIMQCSRKKRLPRFARNDRAEFVRALPVPSFRRQALLHPPRIVTPAASVLSLHPILSFRGASVIAAPHTVIPAAGVIAAPRTVIPRSAATWESLLDFIPYQKNRQSVKSFRNRKKGRRKKILAIFG